MARELVYIDDGALVRPLPLWSGPSGLRRNMRIHNLGNFDRGSTFCREGPFDTILGEFNFLSRSVAYPIAGSYSLYR